MSLFYDTRNLYVVKIARVTKIIEAGWHTAGATYYDKLLKVRFAKLVKKDNDGKYFKLISSNVTLPNNSQLTENRGDLFIYDAELFAWKIENTKRFLSKKALIDLENKINNEDNKQEDEEMSK